MISWVDNLSEEDLLSLVWYGHLYEQDKQPPTPEAIVKKVLGMGIFAAAVVLPGGMPIYYTLQYLKDMYNYKCELMCQRREDVENKGLCYRQCNYKAMEMIVRKLESEIPKCRTTKDPKKCQTKLFGQLKKWRKKEAEARLRLRMAQRGA